MGVDVEDFGALASYSFQGLEPGVRLLVLGAVHGDEICGTAALHRLIDEVERAEIKIRAGLITCVPVANRKAYAKRSREGDRNLNRDLRPTPNPIQYEDYVANVLCPLLAEHDVLLDLHSFSSSGTPFVFVGPENNTGTLEPFQRADEELQFAKSLGLNRMVYGWLNAFDGFVMRQNAFLDRIGPRAGLSKRMVARSACGTTEFMRSVGGYGVTVECGSHNDPDAVNVAYGCIVNALACLGLVETGGVPPAPFRDSLQFVEIYMKEDDGDRLERDWPSFSRVDESQILGVRASGELLRAPSAGYIVFAHPRATIGEDWIHFAVVSPRGT